jgi:nuclear factor of activated T-cells 5
MENASAVVSESPEDFVLKGEVSPLSPSLPSKGVKCAVDSENESVVSSSTGPPAKKLREPSLNLQFPAKSGKMELKILVQPENQHRARYMTEGSRGAVKDESQQGHPKIQLLGYDEPINLQVFVGTDTGKVKPHGFYQACKVCGKNSTACSEKDIEGTVVIEIGLDPAEDMTANIDCVGILKLRNADVEQRIGLARSKKKSTRARLVFRVCIPKADGLYQTLQVASTAISCTQPAGQPEICKKSLSEAPVTGAEELFIIGKNFSKGTQVLFQEICDEKTVWTKEAIIDQEYFQATHLICTVPAYVDTGVSKPVEVQIVVHSSGRVSEPQSFIYQPVAKKDCSTKDTMKEEMLVEEEVAMETDQGSRTSLFVSPAAVALNKMFEEASHGVSKSSPLLSSSLDQEQKMASLACMAPAPFTPQGSKCSTTPTNTTNVNKPMVVTPTLEQLLSAPDQVSVASPPTPPTSALNMPPSLSVESNIQTLNSASQDTAVLGNSRTEPKVVNAFSQCSNSVTGSLPSSTFINSLPSTKVNSSSAPLHITVPVTPDQLQNLLGHALLQSTVSNIGNAAVPQVLLVQPQSLPRGEPVQVRPQSQQQIFSPQIIQLQQCASQAPHIQPQQQTTQQTNTPLQQIFQPQLSQSMHQLSFSVQQQSEQQVGQHDLPQVHQQTVRQVAQKVKPEEAQAQLIELEELRALQKQLKQEKELAQQGDSPMPQQLQEEPLSVRQQKPKPCLSELPLQELQELQQQIHQQEQQRSQQLTSPGQQNLSPRCTLEESQFQKTEADSMIKIVQELQNYEKQHQEQNLQSIHQHMTQHETIQQSVQQHQQQSQTTQHQQPMQQQQIVQSPQQQMIKETQQPQLVQQPQIVQQPQVFQQLQTTSDSPVFQQHEMVEEKPAGQQQQQMIHQPQVIPQQQIITQHQAVLQQQIVQQQVGQPQGIQPHTMVQQNVVGQQIVQQPIIQHTVEQPQLLQNQSPHISAQQPSNVFQSAPLLKVSGVENKQQNVQTITIISFDRLLNTSSS